MQIIPRYSVYEAKHQSISWLHKKDQKSILLKEMPGQELALFAACISCETGWKGNSMQP